MTYTTKNHSHYYKLIKFSLHKVCTLHLASIFVQSFKVQQPSFLVFSITGIRFKKSIFLYVEHILQTRLTDHTHTQRGTYQMSKNEYN